MTYALRQLAKNPGFAATALATLALGIGINTSAFTVLNRFLLQSLPYRSSERLVQVWFTAKDQRTIYQGSGDYVEERAQATLFDEMAAYNYGPQSSVADPGQPAMPRFAVFCSASVFPILGIQPQIGRLFTDDEAKRFEWEVLLSNSFWREHYNADPKVLGRTLMILGKPYTIIGVMPPVVDDPLLFGGPVAVFPLDPFTLVDEDGRHGRLWYRVIGRLKPGVSLEQAQAEMTVIARRIAQDHPKTNKDLGLSVIPFPTTPIADDDAKIAWLVFALCGFILLIGCANLANLQIVRTTQRGQELSIRMALGCSRGRLIRMLIADSLILSAAGGALGLLVAALSNAFLARFFQVNMPLDVRVLGFALVVSLATGLLFGTVPAWLAADADIASSLKAGSRSASSGRSRHRMRQSLVVVELALASTLLAGAGFLVSGIFNITHRDLGWSGDHVLYGNIELDHDHFGEFRDPRSLAFARAADAPARPARHRCGLNRGGLPGLGLLGRAGPD